MVGTPKTAVYLRQSVEDPDGIDRQRAIVYPLCKARQWNDIAEYKDDDESATPERRRGKPRKDFTRLWGDIEEGRIARVVVSVADRLYRHPRDLEDIIDHTTKHKVPIVAAGGELDLATDSGRLVARILGATARGEIERKSARQRDAMDQKARTGRPHWAKRPFGYDADRDSNGRWWTAKKKLELYNEIRLHPTEAKLVKDAYAAVLGGTALHKIAADWNAAGVTAPEGNIWRGQQIRQLLLAERNAGLRKLPGDEVEYINGTWPAIVAEDVWRGVCDKLADPSRRHTESRARKHLMSGLAICGKCGKLLTSGVTTGLKHRNYRCRHCLGVARDGVHVDAMVIEAVVWRLARPDAVELVVDRTREDIEDLQTQVDALRASIRKAEQEYDDDIIDGVRLAARKAKANEKLAPILALMEDRDRAEVFDGLTLGTPEVDEEFDALDLGRKRAIVNALVTCTVNPTSSGRVFRREDVDVQFRQPVAS